jgi:hypothetical protein
MRNIRDPATRAGLCMSCHVGNVAEGKVVTHAMYAAGHPPLPPFEVEVFSKKLPQHWRDLKDIPFLLNPPEASKQKVHDNYRVPTADFRRTHLLLASSLVALRDTMRLAADRAELGATGDLERRWPELGLTAFGLSKNPASRWPELAMAQADCFACHHDLQAPGWQRWRQARGFELRFADGRRLTSVAGRPQVRPWPIALAELSLRHTAKDATEAHQLSEGLIGSLHALYRANNLHPFGDPRAVQEAARVVERWTQERIEERLNKVRLSKDEALKLLRELSTLPAAEFADYETARQITSALKVVYEEWDPQRTQAPAVPEVLKKLEDDLSIPAYSGRAERLALIKRELERKAGKHFVDVNRLVGLLERTAHTPLKPTLLPQELDVLRPFLDALQGSIRDEELASLLLNAEAEKVLYEIGNTDLAKTLQAVAGYDSDQFKRQLDEINRLLPMK